jgi:hypothetical protein
LDRVMIEKWSGCDDWDVKSSTSERRRNWNVMSAQNRYPEYGLLRPAEGSKAEPQFVYDPYPRVIDWGMPEDVHAGDFTFAVLEAALAAGASEIQLDPNRGIWGSECTLQNWHRVYQAGVPHPNSIWTYRHFACAHCDAT